MTCDCCYKTLAGDRDTYPQSRSGVFCGNCDGNEEPGCRYCQLRTAMVRRVSA